MRLCFDSAWYSNHVATVQICLSSDSVSHSDRQCDLPTLKHFDILYLLYCIFLLFYKTAWHHDTCWKLQNPSVFEYLCYQQMYQKHRNPPDFMEKHGTKTGRPTRRRAWKMAVPSITDKAATDSAEVKAFCHWSGAWQTAPVPSGRYFETNMVKNQLVHTKCSQFSSTSSFEYFS